jgi:hypothetical protein
LIDALSPDELHKVLRVRGEVQALFGSEPQKSFPDEGVLEKADGAILQRSIEIDQNIAAAHKVHLGEHGIRHQTVIGKHRPGSQGLVEKRPSIGCGVIIRK